MDPFAPARWWRNAHVQSIFPSLPLRRALVARRTAGLVAASEELLIDCGEGVTLQAWHARPRAAGRESRHLALLLHGWEGSADSMYVRSLGQALFDRGHEVLRLNLRDHGDTHHLNRGIFHSCLLPEVVGAVRAVQARFAGKELSLVGFSLGGNFLLRVAAEPGAHQQAIARVIAISPVLDPASTLHALEQGFGVYRKYFVAKWTRSLLRKQGHWPKDHDFRELVRQGDLRRMTADLVRGHTQFPHIDAYLSGYAITGDRLAALAVQSHILAALDDPIIPAADLQRLARPPALHLHLYPHGGHTGFMESLLRPSWAQGFVVRAIEGEECRLAASDSSAGGSVLPLPHEGDSRQ